MPWWFGPAECDPFATAGAACRCRKPYGPGCRSWPNSGLPFQRVALAHELDPAGPVQELLPSLRRGAVECSAGRAVAGRAAARRIPGCVAAARVLDALVGGLGSGAFRVVDAVLDPIVFGVVGRRSPAR